MEVEGEKEALFFSPWKNRWLNMSQWVCGQWWAVWESVAWPSLWHSPLSREPSHQTKQGFGSWWCCGHHKGSHLIQNAHSFRHCPPDPLSKLIWCEKVKKVAQIARRGGGEVLLSKAQNFRCSIYCQLFFLDAWLTWGVQLSNIPVYCLLFWS